MSLFLKMPWVFTWDKSEADIAPVTLSSFLNFYRGFTKVVSPKTKHAHSQLRTHGVRSVRATERCSRGCPWARPLEAPSITRRPSNPNGDRGGAGGDERLERATLGVYLHMITYGLGRCSGDVL